jgi:hypothetical protein
MHDDRQPPADVVYREEDLNTLPMPNTFFELLDLIRKKPGMYFGLMSFRHFHVWLEGFRFARMQAGLSPLPDDDKFAEFDAFVCDKYRWHDVAGWAAKIEYYYRDDTTAFDQFFKLLDEFRALPPT